MIRSMTGFGRATFEVEEVGFEVEIRTVNHRHLDVRPRLPRALADREAQVKAAVQQALERGKVDVLVSLTGAGGAAPTLEVDEAAAAQLVEAGRRLADAHGLAGGLGVAELLAFPGVARLVERELPGEALEQALGEALATALGAVDAMRRVEGETLEAEFQGRLATVERLAAEIETRSGTVVEAARERLQKRFEQLEVDLGRVDETRLHQEIALAADRLDISEELSRLRSHVEQFRTALASAGRGEPVGRRLDFLLQELGRETNTIGSKANDAGIAHCVVELKTEHERIREQVQNVE